MKLDKKVLTGCPRRNYTVYRQFSLTTLKAGDTMKEVRYPNKIRFFRKKLGLTQHELGQRFRQSKDATVISRWERGIVKPSSEHLLELAEILSVHPNQFYFDDNKTDESGYTKAFA